MDTETKPAQQSDCGKKPYRTPELVVMGEMAEMTQNSTNVGVDTFGFPNPAAS